ncbi:hypothetical protein PMEGAPR54_21350 [Priestia megaterium]
MPSTISKGVNKAAPPTPVKPTRVPTNNPIKVIDSSMFLPPTLKTKYIDLIIEHCSSYVNKILNIFSGVEKVFFAFTILGNGR